MQDDDAGADDDDGGDDDEAMKDYKETHAETTFRSTPSALRNKQAPIFNTDCLQVTEKFRTNHNNCQLLT